MKSYSGDDFSSRQGYLEPAPEGIDAKSVWAKNARGAGVAFIDLERGWFPDHESLRQAHPILVFGENFEADADHGTAVLRTIVGNGDDRGFVGIAPEVSSVRLVSSYRKREKSEGDVAKAIGKAITLLQPGDVLLLEVQKGSPPKPTEVEDLDFEAIRLAVSQGIIVIEAAGNGNLNLDTIGAKSGTRNLNTNDARFFKDSGAIMVGACNQEVLRGGLHSRYPKSNYGSRIDCYAWGEGIAAATNGASGGTSHSDKYARLFGGTSSASAIIAGAALLLQSLYEARKGERLLPNAADPMKNIRAILSDPATGTPQQLNSPSDPIGVMLDLKRIIGKLGLAEEPIR